MPDIKLFGARLSPFVEKVARALAYKALDFEEVPIKGPGDLKKWNPQTRKMPVLEVDGERIHDSTFIVRRLEELVPRPSLIPADPLMAARQRLLEDWCDESLYRYVMGMRWAEENAEATLDQITADIPPLARVVARPMLRRQVGGQARAQGLGRLPLAVLERELGDLLDALLKTMGDGPFFAGDHPGIGDLALYGQICGMCSGPTPQAERLIAERPRLADLRKRVEEVTATSD